MKAIFLGIVASCFFAVSFVLNREMHLAGGSWVWSSSLRFIFMAPLLLGIVAVRKGLLPVWQEIKIHPMRWLIWSMVGFGLFYAPLTFASAFEPGWLIAGTWQITIIAGTLLVPFFYETVETIYGPKRIRRRLPLTGLSFSLLIIIGVGVMQVEQAVHISIFDVFLGFIPVIIAAFAYPLGNRKMMEVCGGRLDAYQRVLGMTLCSLPLWLGLALYGIFSVGAPSSGQSFQALIVAVSSGIIATTLFFTATDMTKADVQKLAAVEATQAGEVIFTLIGEIIFLSASLPSLTSILGLTLVIIGMLLHSLFSHRLDKAVKLT